MFARSLCALDEGALHPFASILSLIERRNAEVAVKVERVPFRLLDGWSADADGALRHASGKFFAVEGIEVETDAGNVPRWQQPIINQPEIGYLGLAAKDFGGVLHFLMQLKIEPGNINCVQVSPTLQATRSNCRQVHQGRRPLYLDRFEAAAPERIIVDQLQSEHGSRFLRKRNRNIIIMLDSADSADAGLGGAADADGGGDFCWMTLGQLKALMRLPNKVNSPARSVLSLLDAGSLFLPFDDTRRLSELGRALLLSARTGDGLHTTGRLLSWLANLKANYSLRVRPAPLNRMADWRVSEDAIDRADGRYFSVFGIRVSIGNREVTSWCQPVIAPAQTYVCAFLVREFRGVPHLLVQAKFECGNYDTLELAPTVQSLVSADGRPNGDVPFLDYVRSAGRERVLYDAEQSEEGGRFYRDRNRYMLVMADADIPGAGLPDRYVWMTLGQVYGFLRFNNFVNTQARTLLAALPYNE